MLVSMVRPFIMKPKVDFYKNMFNINKRSSFSSEMLLMHVFVMERL